MCIISDAENYTEVVTQSKEYFDGCILKNASLVKDESEKIFNDESNLTDNTRIIGTIGIIIGTIIGTIIGKSLFTQIFQVQGD